MWQTEKLSAWEKHAVITFMMQIATDEQKRRLRETLPDTYNTMCGKRVMVVSQQRTDTQPDEGRST